MTEIDKLAQVLKERYGHIADLESRGWPHPSLNVLNCLLSLNRRYDTFARPRVEAFAEHHPNITELIQLRSLIDSYESPAQFSIRELDYDYSDWAQMLWGVVEYLINVQQGYEGSSEYERLQRWATSVTPKDADSVGVRGFGIAGFQHLRVLFGAQTTKPDRHIKDFVSEVVGRRVSERTAIDLLEQAAQRAGLPIRGIDKAIWEERARGKATTRQAAHCNS
jgi:hypothetical protein